MPELPSSNGYDLYVRAARAVPQFDPPVDACQRGMNAAKTAAQGAIFYSLERREAWNDAAAPAWELFAQAQKTEIRDPITPGFEGDPYYGYLRGLAHDKRAQSNMFRMRGDHAGAINSALDGVEMGVAIGHGGALLGRVVSAAIVNDSIRAINDTDLFPDKLSGPIARAAARRLEEIIARVTP